MKSLFDNSSKQYIRNQIINILHETKPTNFISLPHLNFNVEKVANEYGKVTCVEKDKLIYQQQLELDLPFTMYNGNLSDFMSKSFDFGWLDFCGFYSKEVVKVFENSNFNNLVVTFAMSRDHLKDRDSFYPQFLASHGYYVNKVYYYKSNRTPMAAYFCNKSISTIEMFQL